MRLDLVSFRGTTPTGGSSSLLAEWRVGTILQAVAVRDAKTGHLWLELGGQRHPARVASGELSGPADGERMQVRILRTHPVLALETVGASKPSISDIDATVSDALRRFVPKQESPSMMLANLAWLMQGKNGAHALPRSVMEAAAQLWRSLPDAEALKNPKTLEAALQRSGTFLEAKLAAGHSAEARGNLAGDLKALMLGLSRALQSSGAQSVAARSDTAGHAPVPTAHGPLTPLSSAPATFSLLDAPAQQLNELARQTEGALARLTTVQIANNAEPSAHSIVIELPVRHDDRAGILRLRIGQEESTSSDDRSQGAWSVEAAMDLGSIGALHARVTLRGQRIGVQLRAESASVVAALSSRAAELEAVLREAGLEVDRVVCLHGMPVPDAVVRPTRLLDVRA